MNGSHSGVDAAAEANKKLEALGLPLLPGGQPSTPQAEKDTPQPSQGK